jgi:hypothetical protein
MRRMATQLITTTAANVPDPTAVGTVSERIARGIVDRHTVNVPDGRDTYPHDLRAGDRVQVARGFGDWSHGVRATVAYTYPDGQTVGIIFDGSRYVNVYPRRLVDRVTVDAPDEPIAFRDFNSETGRFIPGPHLGYRRNARS